MTTSRSISTARWARRRGRHRAFTLLELVVSMAMVAIIAVSLYATLRGAFRAQQSAEAAVAAPRTADLAMSFLRADLQNALQENADGSSVIIGTFEGTDGKDDRGDDADDLIFFTTAESPDHPSANGEVKKVELTISTPDGTTDHALVRSVTRNLLTQVDPTPDQEVLCRHVAGFNLRYYDGTDWQASWDSTQQTNAIPLAVEVTLTLEQADAAKAGQPPGTVRYTRVFAMPCSTTTAGTLTGTGGGL